MTESNNVRFVVDEGKWVWKCYTNGSVTHRSQLFETEKEAREDYEVNGGQYKPEASAQSNEGSAPNVAAPEDSNSVGNVAPEGEVSAGVASADASQPGADQTV